MSAHKLVLLADDDRNDALFLRRAFQKAGLSHSIVDVRNGRQAANYLAGEVLYADRTQFPLPALIILDLKMPLMDGFELLAWIRRQKQLQTVPAVVLSSSDQAVDKEKALDLGAQDY